MINSKTPLIVLIIIAMKFTFIGCTTMSGGEGCDPDTQDCETIDPVNPEPGWFGATAWHPDGRWIAAEHSVAFDTDEDGFPDSVARSGIWLVDSENGQVQDNPLLEWGRSPDWSPDGRHLVFHQDAHIYTVAVTSLTPPQIDTASIRQLTQEGRNFYPDWSPDGEWIVYDSNNDSPNGQIFIWKMKSDGSEKTRIVFTPEQGEARMPSWSPDSKKLVHIQYLVGVYSSEIFSVNSDGSNPNRLIENEATDYYPRYSPNGSSVAFLSAPPPPAPAVVSIWKMNPDGTGQQKISPDWSGVFSWRPDGRQLVFLKYNPNQPEEGNGQLWLMNPDGTGLRQLTHFNPENLPL